MALNVVTAVDQQVAVRHVLISVSDKSGLDRLVEGLLAANPQVKIFSTGGTFGRIREILGARAEGCLTQVADYTGQPETQGGLVKTLDFKIYLGLLTETYNEAHQGDLTRTAAVPIDMVVVNLYPFQTTVAAADVTPEKARGNIDIGGPCMIRASAKNFIRVASLVDPADYDEVIAALKTGKGATDLALRFRLAQKAFAHTAAYDTAIADYLGTQTAQAVAACYDLRKGENDG
jgi:phosphoribosylaminoimidazolecarboxamide formyltransferase/IMP cyclohydrolase